MSESKPLRQKYQYHLLLVLTGLLWIFVFQHLMQAWAQTYISPDAGQYRESAANLYQHYRGHNYRPMLMALINGIPYLFGASDADIFMFSNWVNLCCWLGSILLLFEILSMFVKPKLAFVFAGTALFFVGLNILVFELATENIYVFLLMAVFYFLMQYHRKEAFKYLCFALSLVILSMLVKPGSKFLAVVFTLFFIKEIIFNYSSKFAWLIYGSYFLVLVQCAGIKYQFGNFTLSYIDAVTYYDYLGARAESLESERPFKEVWLKRANYIYSFSCPEQKQIASQDFRSQLQYNTRCFFKGYGINLIENATDGSQNVALSYNVKEKDNFESIKNLVFNISKWQNRLLSILALLLSAVAFWKVKSIEMPLLLMAFFVCYIILLSGVSCSEGDRFNVVTFPFAMVLLAKFLSDRKWVKS